MKKLITMLLLCIILCLSLISCGESDRGAEFNIPDVDSDYFDAQVVEEINSVTFIIRDKNTDVLYLVVGGYSSCVMTPIYNSDGTIKLYGKE